MKITLYKKDIDESIVCTVYNVNTITIDSNNFVISRRNETPEIVSLKNITGWTINGTEYVAPATFESILKVKMNSFHEVLTISIMINV